MNYQALEQKKASFLYKQSMVKSDTLNGIIGILDGWYQKKDLVPLLRINPFKVSGELQKPATEIVDTFLYGVQDGFFSLHWDVHCPHCDSITDTFENLNTSVSESSCPMCAKDFEVDFVERVEVTFSLDPEIFHMDIPPVCNVPSSIQDRYYMVLPQGSENSVVDTLPAGRYRYYCPITLAKGILKVEGEPTDEIQKIKIEQLKGDSFDYDFLTVRPGPLEITVSNQLEPIAGFHLHEDDLPELKTSSYDKRLSGLELLHFRKFNELFEDQVLSNRERMKISSVSFLFTDIAGSTSMYETLGDAVAYNIVRDHFDILFQAIEKANGTIVKTVGDAVMASFVSSAQAMEALFELKDGIQKYNDGKDDSRGVKIRAGIHRGPCILVNLNDRIDYFGTTVNRASRLESISRTGEVSFSEEVFEDRSVKKFLSNMGVKKVSKRIRKLNGLKSNYNIFSFQFLESE